MYQLVFLSCLGFSLCLALAFRIFHSNSDTKHLGTQDDVARVKSIYGRRQSLWVVDAPKPFSDRTECLGHSEMGVTMTDEELQAFRFLVEREENQDKLYIEWGSGGSTTVATPWFKKAYVIENHPEWCDLVVQNPRMACLIEKGVIHFECVSPSKVGKWGRPEEEDVHLYKPYFNKIQDVAKQEGMTRFDMIFIDGRFRVACALAALEYMDENSLMVMHDFWNRHYRKTVLEFYQMVEGNVNAQRLGVFRKKPFVNATLLAVAIEEAAHDSD